MTRKKISFIVNPKSGLGRQKRIESVLSKTLDHSIFAPSIQFTEAPGHGLELSREAVEKEADLVVAVGGDGTVNECARALLGTSCALGIIPCGSGNGLARHLGIPMNLEKAIAYLNTHKVRTIDTASLNGKPYMGVAGVGFDAHISKVFSSFGQRGFLSYIRLVMREYKAYPSQKYKVIVDGKVQEVFALLIAVANSSQFGINARITPMAIDDDGLLDIAILGKFPMINGISMARKLFGGKLEKSNYTTYLRGRSVEIIQTSVLAHIDGEPIEPGENLVFEIRPRSLLVAVPREN